MTDNNDDNNADNNDDNNRDIELTRMVEQVIDKGASSAEEIHRAVGELPISVLESLGMKDTAHDVKNIQDRSIGAIYKMIRNVNHQVADLASDLLDKQTKSQQEREK